MKTAIDPRILPKEYGGEIPLCEMIGTYTCSFSFSQRFSLFCFSANFKKTLREQRNRIKELDDMYIEITSADCHYVSTNDDLCGISGSFRKLEVD